MFGGYRVVRNMWYLQSFEIVDAQIVSCAIKRFERTKRRGRSGGARTSYTPVAKTDDGVNVEGVVYFSRERCYEKIGMNVSVIVDSASSKKKFINTFIQFWMTPLIILIIPILLNIFIFVPLIRANENLKNDA